jgi:sterol desaturase/sphingolipid hydroxylase (fatty acid hydroxylase superfamily)
MAKKERRQIVETPTEARQAEPGPSVLVLLVIGTGLAIIVLGLVVAGALVAYAWYLFVHHCAHHGPDKLPLPLLKHHQRHHRFGSRNYGVSTTLWDHYSGRCCADNLGSPTGHQTARRFTPAGFSTARSFYGTLRRFGAGPRGRTGSGSV